MYRKKKGGGRCGKRGRGVDPFRWVGNAVTDVALMHDERSSKLTPTDEIIEFFPSPYFIGHPAHQPPSFSLVHTLAVAAA